MSNSKGIFGTIRKTISKITGKSKPKGYSIGTTGNIFPTNMSISGFNPTSQDPERSKKRDYKGKLITTVKKENENVFFDVFGREKERKAGGKKNKRKTNKKQNRVRRTMKRS
jgi:hypothetical protein